MRTGILMVTYWRDLEFARYSFQSVERFTSGFANKVVVVPEPDAHAFLEATSGLGWTIGTIAERPGKGMLHHMVAICEADRWLPDCDAILHLDADNLFTEAVTPEEYIEDGKPILWRQRYEDFRVKEGHRYRWKATVDAAMGLDAEYETMLRHPSMHLPCVYQKTRELIAAHTGMDWKEYILSCKNEYPQTFAEFPTLGAVAIKYFPELYSFVTKEGDKWMPEPRSNKLFNFWSHGGLEHINDRHPGRMAKEVIADILK